MGTVGVVEAVAGGALLFVVPGFAVTKALFPERRVRGVDGVRWLVELVTLSLVLSVVLTVLVGYVLLQALPGGFSASWTDPWLETILASIALLAGVAGLVEGAYARTPPARRGTVDGPGEAGAWELTRELDRLQRERLGLERELARARGTDAAPDLRARLAAVSAEESAVQRRREAEYDL